MKIFFFGGSFNPPHFGHLKIIEKCSSLSDKLIIFPNKISLEKSKNIDSYHRVNMLKMLLNKGNVMIDDFELRSNKKNYTIYTIEYLMKKYNNNRITMVIGLDQLANLHKWYRYKDIINIVDILCFNRKTYHDKRSIPKYKNLIYLKDFNEMFSSSMVRESICETNNSYINKAIPRDVLKYIEQNNLYV